MLQIFSKDERMKMLREKQVLKDRILESFADLHNCLEMNTTIAFDASDNLKCCIDRYNKISEDLIKSAPEPERDDSKNYYKQFNWWQVKRVVEYAIRKVKNRYGFNDTDVDEFYANDSVTERVEFEYLVNKEIDDAMEELRKYKEQKNKLGSKDLNNSHIEQDSSDEEDVDDLEEKGFPNQNDDFLTVRELVIRAVKQYAAYHPTESINEFIERLEDALDNFGQGHECEEQFSFCFTDKFDSWQETWEFRLDDDGLQILDYGYVNGSCGGDSYTNAVYYFYSDGTSEKSIMACKREFENIIQCGESMEFTVEMPEEFVGCGYKNEGE